jgi:uncharacterized protein YhjY with autotransporter beta-barrel domain
MLAFRYVIPIVFFLIFIPGLPLFPGNIARADLIDSKIGLSGTIGDDTLINYIWRYILSDLVSSSPENVTTGVTGIDGLSGNDFLTNNGFMDLDASSVIDVPYTPTETTGATATSMTAGILGGDGLDTLTNIWAIYSTSDASAFMFNVIAQIDPGLLETPTSAIAKATGLEGGNNPDTIDNSSVISATAISDSEVQESHFSAVEVPLDIFAFGDGKTTATSTSIAIDGDMQTGTPTNTTNATEIISNSGTLTALSEADATKYIGMIELLGAARVDDSTAAKAYSAGIYGGVNDNIITNTGTIDVDAISSSDMTSWEIKMKGLMVKPVMDVFGLDVGTYKTTADALAVGIFGNTGNNALYNYGSGGAGGIDVFADADADSKIFTFSISPPLGGGGKKTAGVSLASAFLPDLSIVTTSGDIPTYNGSSKAYGDARTVAAANAFGILSDQGNDTIENHVALSSTADADAQNLTLSVDINISKTDYLPLPGAAVADASTTALALSNGLDGGAGNDIIDNTASVDAIATADADSLGIAATIKGSMEGLAAGVAVTDSSSAAFSAAKGMSGGTGGDTITNSGPVTAYSEAQADAVSVSVTLAGDKAGIAVGVTLADALTRADAYSIGIDAENDGGDETASTTTQIDDITNSGEIWSTSIAGSHADAVGVSLGASLEGIAVSVSLTDTDVKSEARASGIRTGIGEDIIHNTGAGGIHSTSTATSSSDAVSVSVSGAYKGVSMGASYAEANTEAAADSVGITSEASDDTILNHAAIDTSSTANVDSDAVAVTASVAIYGFSAGAAMSNAQTNSKAAATGIDAGDGDDTVENTAIMTTTASAYTETDSITINFAEAGAAIADVSSEAKAEAIGIDVSNGVDDVTNTGTISVSAVSVSDDTNTVVNLAGYAEGDIGSTSTAHAVGIAGGDGTGGETAGDTLINDTGGNITVVSTANAYSDNYVVQGGGLSLADLGSKTHSSATAIKAGALGDTIENDGTAISVAKSDIKASSFNFSLFGIQVGSVGVNAIGTARGIDAGSGKNTITNKTNGIINTCADISTTALNTQVSIGPNFTHAGVTSDAYAQGIFSGADSDTIDNQGSIITTAHSLGQAAGASIGLISASLVNALAFADIDGIYAGGGNDNLVNNGTIIAGAINTGDNFLVKAETAAVSGAFASLIFSSLGAEALITGIQGGSGNDTIMNNGTIYIGDAAPNDACTNQRSMVIGDSYGYGGQWLGTTFVFSGSSARATSIGIDGGADNDTLINTGTVTVKARSYGDVGAEVSLGIGLTDSLANAEVKSTANATGIFGGSGADTFTNTGSIAADALTIADAETDADIDLATEPEAKSEATAVARAAGIDGGSLGEKHIDNYSTITAVANAGAWTRMHSNTADKRAHTTGFGLAQSEAYGITSESLCNTTTNHDTGSIVVSAMAGTYNTLGNTGYAYADEDANIDAGWYNTTTNQWIPLSAKAGGILFLDGDDIVVNDGTVTVTSSVNGTIYADSNSWVRYPFSTARSVVFSQAKGISAGKGQNVVTNNGQLTIQALSHAQPKVYSWSRDYQATANAHGKSTAEATGMEADGILFNNIDGVLDVTARATSWANAPTNSEYATATAELFSTATGFSPFTTSGLTDIWRITNNGQATVKALAGEDVNGNSQQIAWVNTNISVRDSTANCHGTSTVDAVGVRAGDGEKEIINNGTLTVLGRARADLTTAGGAHTYARSRDYNPDANSYATGVSTATGVHVSGGENHIYNFGTMDVQAQTVDVYGWSDSYSRWRTCHSKAETKATATGQGMFTGDGNDDILNSGTLSVASYANAHSYAYADTRDNNIADEYETSLATSSAKVTGINGGDGYNTIENQGSLSVSATSLAQVYAGGGHASVTAVTSSTASSIGIYGGEDGSYIHNSGAIDVNALAYYINGYPYHGVSASGIVGGSGNDTIINEGTIISAMGSGVWPGTGGSLPTSPGIGITAGAGNDTVILGAGSSVTGSILLGEGDDTLGLSGTPIINGIIDPGTGSNSLVLDGPGACNRVFNGYQHASKIAGGTYTISGINPLASLDVQRGTLRVHDNYQFTDTGLFSTSVFSDGSSGKFEIMGTGSLDGAITVSKEDAFYATAMTYDIITAHSLTDEFADVVLPEPTTLLAFSMKQTPDTIQILTTPQSFTTVATNDVERRIAKYLDTIGPHAQGDLAEVMKTFQLLSPGEFKKAFSGMSPAHYGGMSATGHDIVRNAGQRIASHLQDRRSSSSSSSFVFQTPVLLSRNSYNAQPQGLTFNNNRDVQTNTFNFWAEGFSRWGSQDGSDGYTGYDFNTYGMALGLEYLFQNWLVGAGIERSNADQDFDSKSGDGSIHTFMTSLYANFYLKHLSVESILSYGRQSYDNTRYIIIGDIFRKAKSNHDANLFSAYLGGEYDLPKGRWQFAPFGNIQYTILDEDGFTETGADSLNLIVDEKTTKSLVSQMGVHISRPFKKQNGRLIPKFSLAGIYDFDIDDRAITSGFSGSPADSFTIDSQDVDHFGIAVETELSWLYKNGFGVSMSYSGEFRDSFKTHAVTAKVKSRHGFSTSIGYAKNFQNGRPEEVVLGKIQINF